MFGDITNKTVSRYRIGSFDWNHARGTGVVADSHCGRNCYRLECEDRAFYSKSLFRYKFAAHIWAAIFLIFGKWPPGSKIKQDEVVTLKQVEGD